MKSQLLRSLLILCLLFLGFKNAEAATLTETTIASSADPLYRSQTHIAIMGFSLTSTNNGTSTFNGITFTGSGRITDYFSGTTIYLYSNTTNDFTTASSISTGTVTGGGQTGLSFTFPTQSIVRNDTKYYWVVADFTGTMGATPGTFQLTMNNGGINTTATDVYNDRTGPIYNMRAGVLNQGQTTGGLTANPITTAQSNVVLMGESLTSGGTSTITSLNFTSTKSVATYFPTGTIAVYSSTSSTFPGIGSATLVASKATSTVTTTANFAVPAAQQTINNGVTMYYYVVLSTYTPPAATTTFEVDIASVTVATNTGINYGDQSGTSYSLVAPTLTVANNTGGLTASPIDHDQSQAVLFSFSAAPAGGTANITGFTFTGSSTINTILPGSILLYSSTSSTFPGTGTATLVKTITSPASTTLTTGTLTESIPNGSALYYYLVGNLVDNTVTGTPATFQFKLTTVATSMLVSGTTVNGINYSIPAPVTLDNPAVVNLAANPLVGIQSNIAIMGFTVATTQSKTFTQFNFAANRNINTYFSGLSLYVGTTNDATAATTLISSAGVVSGAGSNVLTFSGLSQTQATGTLYYFVKAATYTPPTTTATTFELDCSSVAASALIYTNGAPATGTLYTMNPPALTVANNTGGLVASPLDHDQAKVALFSFSAAATGGNVGISALTFTATTNISATLPTTVWLYSSTSPTFPGIATATLVKAIASPGTTTMTVGGLTETIPTGTTLYYYLVGDFTDNATTATPLAFQFKLPTVTATANVTGTTVTGTNYSILSPVTLDNPTVTNLAANPLIGNQTNIAIMGFTVATTQSKTFTQFSFTATRNINTYFSGLSLYVGTTNDANAATTLVSSTGVVNGTGNVNLTFSGLSQTQATGTLYYFVKAATYTPPATTATTFQLNGNSVSTAAATYTNGAPNNGTLYTMNPNTLTVANNTGGLAANPLDHDQAKVALFSFSAAGSGTANISALTFTANSNFSATLPTTVWLYSSTSATFPGIGTATLVKTIASPANTTLTVTGLTESIPTGTTLYYYLVGDFTDNVVSATTANFQIKLTTVTSTANVSGTTVNGTNYTISSPVTINDPAVTGLSPVALTTNQSNIYIMGFTVATTQSKTFSQFNFTATSSISPAFSGFSLYAGTSNNAAAATTLVSSSGVVSGATNTTLTFSSLSQTQATGILYYFIKATSYTAPSDPAIFELDCNSVATAASTYTNGAPAIGTVYYLGPPAYDWTGASSTAWTTAGNWSVNGVAATTYPGQGGVTTNPVRFGINFNYTRQPTLSSSLTVASITFGNNNGTANTLTVTGAAVTLTVTGNIAQNHPTGNTEITTVAGTGNLICNGNFIVGDAVMPNSGSKNATSVHSTINHMTINGDIILNSVGRGETNPSSVNYPYFGLDANTLTLLGQIKFTATGNPYNAGSSLNGSDLYQNLARFNMDTFNANSTFLELLNPVTIPAPNPNFYVDFTNLGGNSTVTYKDPNAGDSQLVYTSTTSGLGVNEYNYINLIFSGASTKVVLGDDLTIGNTWTTNGTGAVNLNTNSPNITTQNDWVNTTNVTQGGATIEVGDDLTNNANTIACGSGTLTVDGDFANNTGTFQCGSGKVFYKGAYLNSDTFTAGTGMVYFSGVGQSLKDNSTAGSTFNNVTFNGTGNTAITASTGNFAVSSIGTLTMGTGSKLTPGSGNAGGAGYLTLMSDANSTASIAALPASASIVGAVNVQRYITGGTGTRGYRLLSSPVNASLATTGNIALGYMGTSASFGGTAYPGAFTQGPGSGFTLNGTTNPIIYLYDESKMTDNRSYTGGKNIGIFSISGSTVTTLTGTTQAAATIPVGNSYLLYFVGNNTSTSVATTRVPENTVITATGYINRGTGTNSTFPVKFWNTGLTEIPYHTGTGGYLPGLNQVGNPFPSTISLAKVSTDNPAVSKIFWELVPGGNYVSYSTAAGNPVSDSRASNFIVSGQGFLVQAQGTGETISFRESEKVAYPTGLSSPFNTTTNTALLLDIPNNPVSTNDVVANNDFVAAAASPIENSIPAQTTGQGLTGLHLQLTKDIYNHVQTGIYFGPKKSDIYVQDEDAISISGSGAQVFLSSYTSDNINVGINQVGDYTKGKRIKLYAGVSSTGLYTISLADVANIDTNNFDIFLIDKKLNDSLDMRRYKTYTFNINNSDTSTYGANRFVLVIEHTPVAAYVLNSFIGKKVSSGVELDWEAQNAGNYTGYILQKKNSSGNYAQLYKTQSNGSNAYSYTDLQPNTSGKNVYRLKQTGINGNITFSQEVTIDYGSTTLNDGLTIYPNPSKTHITISLTTTDKTKPDYIADIYDASGTIIKHREVKANNWAEDISTYKLGPYILNITDSNGKLVGQSKFIKIN